MRLLVKFPTRQRVTRFLDVLRLYMNNRRCKDGEFFLTVVCDVDDEGMSDPRTVAAVIDLGAAIHFGAHKTKMEAINSPLYGVDYDVLLLASDDMIPVIGYDQIIADAFAQHFPDYDGVLHFNDGYTGERLNTLVCAGKKYLDRQGYIYHPDYISVWCDNEFMVVSRAQKKAVYLPTIVCRHEHPANTAAVKKDALYDKNESVWHVDAETFKKREAAGFPKGSVL